MHIRVRNLSKSFGSNKVLDDVSFDIESGASLVILGKSGTGKSVLIKCMVGLLLPDEGEVFLDEKKIDLRNSKSKSAAFEQYGFLFQGGALFDSLTVKENITFRHDIQLTDKQLADFAVSKLEEVGLDSSVLNSYPSELSGGMQKRVAFARAISNSPKVMFLDEPTSGLDPVMSNIISNLIIDSKRKMNSTSVTITHDMNSMKKIASHVMLIAENKIAWYGRIEDIETSDNKALYNFVNGIS